MLQLENVVLQLDDATLHIGADMRTIPEAFTTGAQLKQARDVHLMPQATLANHLGISRNTVNRLEAGAMVMQRHTGLHAALLFHYLGAQAEPAKAAAPRAKSRYPASASFAFTTCDLPHTRLAWGDAQALPAGSRYRMMVKQGSNLGSWNIMVRGIGDVLDDATASESVELSDQAWLDNTAKRFE